MYGRPRPFGSRPREASICAKTFIDPLLGENLAAFSGKKVAVKVQQKLIDQMI
jgi:hypothetical protein